MNSVLIKLNMIARVLLLLTPICSLAHPSVARFDEADGKPITRIEGLLM